MGRKKINDYKYTVKGIRQGIWHDFLNLNFKQQVPLDYWHLKIQVNVQAESPQDMYEKIKNDLEPVFGDVSLRTHAVANTQAFDDNTDMCFQNFMSVENDKWILDLHLKKFWYGELKILKEK